MPRSEGPLYLEKTTSLHLRKAWTACGAGSGPFSSGSKAATTGGRFVCAGPTIKSTIARVEEDAAASIKESKMVAVGPNNFFRAVTRVLTNTGRKRKRS